MLDFNLSGANAALKEKSGNGLQNVRKSEKYLRK